MVALEFTDAFDLTAVGTLALAAVTLVSLVIARRALSQTKEEIEVSRREVEEAHRPVVAPVADHRKMELTGRDVGTIRAAPAFRSGKIMMVPIENIGTGPALHIEGRVELLTSDGKPAGHGGEPKSIGTVALAASALGMVEFATQGWTDGVCFALTLTYDDVAETGWQTTARYLIDASQHDAEGRYEDLDIGRAGRG